VDKSRIPDHKIVPTRGLDGDELLRRSHGLPDIDAPAFQTDIDSVVDQRL